MKFTLHYLYTSETHATDFDCYIDGSTDVPPRHKPTFPTDHESTDYWLSPLLYNGPTPISGHNFPIQFWHSLNQLQTKTKMMSKVHNTSGSAGLDFQMEEGWGETIKYLQTDTPNRKTFIIWLRLTIQIHIVLVF